MGLYASIYSNVLSLGRVKQLPQRIDADYRVNEMEDRGIKFTTT